VCAHLQALLDIDHLKVERQRLEEEIRELEKRKSKVLTHIAKNLGNHFVIK